MSIRIGWGEFYRPEIAGSGSNEAVKWHARLQFVKAIDEIQPLSGVLEIDVFPTFAMLVQDIVYLAKGKETVWIPKGWSTQDALKTICTWDAIESHIGSLPPLERLTPKEPGGEIDFIDNPNLKRFLEHVNKHNKTGWWGYFLAQIAQGINMWAHFCNLQDAKWFHKMVIIMFWRKIFNKKRLWATPLKKEIFLNISPPKGLSSKNQKKAIAAAKQIKNTDQFLFKTRHWSPLLETKDEAKYRIINAFTKHLEKELEQIETLCQTACFERTPEKRNPEHFRWLVYYLVKEMDYEKIAQKYTDEDPEGIRVIGTDAVRKAIKSTAELVGISFRK